MILTLIATIIMAIISVTIGFGGFMFFFEKSFDIEEKHPLRAFFYIALALVILISGIIAPIYIGQKLKLREKIHSNGEEKIIVEEIDSVETKFNGFIKLNTNQIENDEIWINVNDIIKISPTQYAPRIINDKGQWTYSEEKKDGAYLILASTKGEGVSESITVTQTPEEILSMIK